MPVRSRRADDSRRPVSRIAWLDVHDHLGEEKRRLRRIRVEGFRRFMRQESRSVGFRDDEIGPGHRDVGDTAVRSIEFWGLRAETPGGVIPGAADDVWH